MQYGQQEFDKAVYLIRQSLDASNEREMYLMAYIVHIAKLVRAEFGWDEEIGDILDRLGDSNIQTLKGLIRQMREPGDLQ